MRALELTRAGILGTILVIVVALACVRLGFWQLDRRAQRLARNAAVVARAEEAPVVLTGAPGDTAGLTGRRATAAGTYDDARTIILGGRSLGGTPGVHVYVPLRVNGGAILVNRGWVPSPDAATVDLAPLAVDTPVTVTGRLLALPETGAAAGAADEGFRTTWFRLDADPLRAQFPYPVSPVYLQLESADLHAALRATRLDPGAPAALPPPSLDSGPHLSYAIQWFGFAIIFLGGWAALVMRRAGTPRAGPRYQERGP